MKAAVLLVGVVMVLSGCEAFQSFVASPEGQSALEQGGEAAAAAVAAVFPGWGFLASPVIGGIIALISGGKG